MTREERDEAFDLGRAHVGRETEKALFVNLTKDSLLGATSIWVPKSAVHSDSECFDAKRNAEGRFVVQRWWARAQGYETE